jgi:hypothetical protein
MKRCTILLAAALAFGLTACESNPKTPAAPACDLDRNNLEGEFISLKGGGSGKDVPDKFARVKFFTEDGKKKAVYTAGQLAPGNPATNKYTYDYVKDTGQDTLYSINMFPNKSTQRIERLKKDNRRLDVKFEGRLYIKVVEKQCALSISDMYVTYVKGEETMDSNPTGTRTFVPQAPGSPPLGFVHCTDSRMLWPFAQETPDYKKDQPLDLREGVYKGEPVWLHYVEPHAEGPDEEIDKQLKKWGVRAEEGCSYEFELWAKDQQWGETVKVEPDENGTLAYKKQVTFDSAPVDGIFVEMHRYKTCADGKRQLLSNACNVIAPEPERTDEEKNAPAEPE